MGGLPGRYGPVAPHGKSPYIMLKTDSLLNHTRELLRRRTQEGTSLLRIAAQSHLPFYWLRKLHAGTVKDPSVNRVQKLYEHLTQSKLLS